MRTFHIGGAASRAAAVDNVQVKTTGNLKFNNLKTVQHAQGHLVAVSRSGELSVLDVHGRERERYKVPYGADDHGQGRRRGQGRARRGDLGSAYPSDRVGSRRLVRFIDFIDGVTVQAQTDD